MLRRNLIYTAVSRAKRQVVLVGQKQALYIAIDKNDIDQRNTLLADRIVSYYRQMNAGKKKILLRTCQFLRTGGLIIYCKQ